MGLLVWMVLVVLVSSVTHLSAVDVNWLTEVVRTIRTEYRINGQFCQAVNISLTQDKNKLEEILKNNSCNTTVSEVIKGGGMYKQDTIIAEHKEGEPVLTNLQLLNKTKERNFLLIYSYLSSCSKCTDWNKTLNTLELISTNVKDQPDSVFVFTTVYNKELNCSTVSRDVLEGSISELVEVMGGLSKVYHCYGQNEDLQCHSCSVNRVVSEVCINNNASSGQAGSRSGYRGPIQRSRSRTYLFLSPNQDTSAMTD